ncbi:ornithine cyclodeaminase family protein [Lactobacillus sp. ESL0236]|uniref:ornithine cyclodeaminase family protein n=1 Tax=unclassified Lactobacillus TaxID=2620435 RepID=UPI000EFC6F85|nr:MULTISPECIES: ornithine cyclodeaminase family protein [unclassified Lactobacillus]RMC42015.1 ornithine cyclodeaminase family protein [Lactobacillus sp. ESL0237]RMC45622.1 ornithine cyclodeaminase family protein [Lactobacillus sp. ESL0234]RMC47009.1 ornithine cyclodeaminase family protein [Lactobacillus sp. ESL0236]
MLILTKNDIEMCYSIKDCISAVQDAFEYFSAGKVDVPLRTQIVKSNGKDSFLCMPAFCEAYNAACVKVLNMFPENINKGRPSINAQVLNIDTKTGEINAILDGNYVTQLRTGAASGVALKYLAKKDCHKGALIGTGGQATTQLEAMLLMCKPALVQVSDLDFARATRFAQEMQQKFAKYQTKIMAVESANTAIKDADVIISVTPSTTPVYDASYIKAGATICGVGSYQPQMEETPAELVTRADKIYFDSQAAVLAESGDLIIPLNKGLISQAKLTGEIGRVISGELVGRENDQEVIFFETVGIAAQDLMTVKTIYQKAVEQKIGSKQN